MQPSFLALRPGGHVGQSVVPCSCRAVFPHEAARSIAIHLWKAGRQLPWQLVGEDAVNCVQASDGTWSHRPGAGAQRCSCGSDELKGTAQPFPRVALSQRCLSGPASPEPRQHLGVSRSF